MLPKEKTKLDHENCYLLGESNYGYGLVYLLETKAEYELIYKNEQGYINTIDTFGGYRLHEPREIYDMLSKLVLSDKEIVEFNYKMYEYHAALSAWDLSAKYSRFKNDELFEYYKRITDQIRTEISELLSPEGEQND